jgi:transposase
MVRVIEDLIADWRYLDERIEGLSAEIEAVARQDAGCERLMSVPGIGSIICPSRKSYPRVLMMQAGQNGRSGNSSA